MSSGLNRWRRLSVAWMLVLGLATALGCLGEPEIDERWTLLELVDVTPQPGQALAATQPINVTVKTRTTYRKILTGFLVAEVRYSDTIFRSDVTLDPLDHTLEVAQDVDRILANSVTAGRATRAVTGFDHLMWDLELSFSANVPAAMFPTPGQPAAGALYLLLYMGEGEEIELQNGQDSLVVTPFVSTDYEVLHTGFVLDITPP
jgi:hypothetical protein